MCRCEKSDFSFQGILLAENVGGILERQWSRMRRCMMKWQQYGN